MRADIAISMTARTALRSDNERSSFSTASRRRFRSLANAGSMLGDAPEGVGAEGDGELIENEGIGGKVGI